MHDTHNFGTIGVIDAVINLFSPFFTKQQFRVTQNLQMMRDRRTADFEQPRNVVNANFLTGFEYQQDLLAGGIAQCKKEAGKALPAGRETVSELGIHAAGRRYPFMNQPPLTRNNRDEDIGNSRYVNILEHNVLVLFSYAG